MANYQERETEFEVYVDVPGVEDVGVTVQDRTLEVTGTRWGTAVKQLYTLPRDVDVERIQARLARGVLTVTVPKKGRRVIPVLETPAVTPGEAVTRLDPS